MHPYETITILRTIYIHCICDTICNTMYIVTQTPQPTSSSKLRLKGTCFSVLGQPLLVNILAHRPDPTRPGPTRPDIQPLHWTPPSSLNENQCPAPSLR